MTIEDQDRFINNPEIHRETGTRDTAETCESCLEGFPHKKTRFNFLIVPSPSVRCLEIPCRQSDGQEIPNSRQDIRLTVVAIS
jgi:hypothetical protein